MLNLSITACSFHLKKSNSVGNKNVYELNKPIKLFENSKNEKTFNDSFELFKHFFEKYSDPTNDEDTNKVFKCTYNNEKIESKHFTVYPVVIDSGMYGSSSEIMNIKTQKINYKKSIEEVELRKFYLFIVIPKDSNTKIQKGMLIFQNIGPYGVKTIITQKIQEFFSNNYKITLNCYTIAPSLFIKKVLKKESIKNITVIKNYKSSDGSDNFNLGYGKEIKTYANLSLDESKWDKIKNSMLYVSGAKNRLFEFLDGTKYDSVKATVKVGDKERTISLNNLENLSIIEPLPDEIKDNNGNPDKDKLIEHIKKVIKEYLEEMVLEIE